MHVIDRLEKRARELDLVIRERGMRNYPQWAADDRELLLDAVKFIRVYVKLSHALLDRKI